MLENVEPEKGIKTTKNTRPTSYKESKMSTVKTFKYVGNPSSGQMEPGFKNDITPKSKGGQHRNSGRHDTPTRMQQRNAQQNRNPPPRKNSKKQIRVSDGEKCVPPAKSKAKQRRNLGDTDLGYV